MLKLDYVDPFSIGGVSKIPTFNRNKNNGSMQGSMEVQPESLPQGYS